MDEERGLEGLSYPGTEAFHRYLSEVPVDYKPPTETEDTDEHHD